MVENVNSALLANKQKRDADSAPVTPPATVAPVVTPTTQSIPVPAPAVAAPVVEKPSEAVPETTSKQPDAAKESAKPETTPATQTPPLEEVEEYKWDADIPDETVTPAEAQSPAQIDIKKIGSALNLDVKDEQEFVTTVSQKLTKLKELEAIDTLPESLKLAIDVAKKGGDWLALTGAVAFDANALLPEELFDRQFERENLHLFKNPDGSINIEAYDAELASVSPALKKMHGNMIKQQIVARQQQQKNEILARTAAQQERFQKGLSDAAQELSKTLPKEKFGISIEPKHSAYLYKGVADGTLIKKHLGNIDAAALAQMDPKRLMATVAIAELGEKISEFNKKQGIAEGKKQLLKVATNPQVQSPSYAPRPNDPGEPAPVPTSAERLAGMQERQKPKNSL